MPSHVASAFVGALAALASLAGPAAASPCVIPKAKLAVGTYVGAHSSVYNQDNFLGIPYAKPPVGDLRFAAPEPYTEKFDTPRNATQYGWMCIGYGADTTNLGSPVNEDCLTLNVVRPRGVKPGDDLPVGVWVHGGVSFFSSIHPICHIASRWTGVCFPVARTLSDNLPPI